MDSEDGLRLSLETVADIMFEGDGLPRKLWQTKHQVDRQGSLGDASPDLWKTLHYWIQTSNDHSACLLFITATAPPGIAASLLGRRRTEEDVFTARGRLDAVAQAAGNRASRSSMAKRTFSRSTS